MIFLHVITDDADLIVCGSLWPGAYDGAPPPDWFANGGPPIKDKRTFKPQESRPGNRNRTPRNRPTEDTEDDQ